MGRLFAGTQFEIPQKCELCDQLETDCKCTVQDRRKAEEAKQREAKRLAPEQQTAKVRIEKRKGKRVVTLVSGLLDEANDLPAILAKLQSQCGTGGSVDRKQSEILIQGDHERAVKEALLGMGFRIR